MENKIDKIIRLNIELEGALRVVKDRQSSEAFDAAKKKFNELAILFQSLNTKDDARATDLKILEAESAESSPLGEPETPDGDAFLSKIRATDQELDTKKEIRKIFTLNDRFLFKRELFANNDEEFNATLDLIGSMTSFDEAQEYIYDDLRWDRETPRVREFMNIVQSYFK